MGFLERIIETGYGAFILIGLASLVGAAFLQFSIWLYNKLHGFDESDSLKNATVDQLANISPDKIAVPHFLTAWGINISTAMIGTLVQLAVFVGVMLAANAVFLDETPTSVSYAGNLSAEINAQSASFYISPNVMSWIARLICIPVGFFVSAYTLSRFLKTRFGNAAKVLLCQFLVVVILALAAIAIFIIATVITNNAT